MGVFNAAQLLNNPRWKTTFVIRRTTVTVDDDGVAAKVSTDIPATGVVVPSGGLGMTRTPETERQGSGITIYTETTLQTGSSQTGTLADDVIWHDQLYQVTKQDDWSEFNFNVAEAILSDPGGRTVA